MKLPRKQVALMCERDEKSLLQVDGAMQPSECVQT